LKEINSIQNPLIKQVVSLQNKSRERRKTGFFVIEGQREVILAIKAGYRIKTLLINDTKTNPEELFLGTENLEQTEVIKVSDIVYRKLAYRESTEGIFAIAEAKNHHLENLNIRKKYPLILVAEAPEKPGNIGALLRTADAAGVDAVMIANQKTDLYNPNIIRSSVGCIFTNQIATGTTSQIITFLKENNIAIYAAALQSSVPYINVDFTKAAAIVVGTEATGLEEQWLQNSSKNIIIPMRGKIDSLNVSNAAAILIFEACRQRGFETKKHL
jgi:TrmH family RNA methyltransferase